MDNGNEDLYQLLTYLIVVIVSSIIMVAWLKRKGVDQPPSEMRNNA